MHHTSAMSSTRRWGVMAIASGIQNSTQRVAMAVARPSLRPPPRLLLRVLVWMIVVWVATALVACAAPSRAMAAHDDFNHHGDGGGDTDALGGLAHQRRVQLGTRSSRGCLSFVMQPTQFARCKAFSGTVEREVSAASEGLFNGTNDDDDGCWTRSRPLGTSTSIAWQPRGGRWSLVTMDTLNGDGRDGGNHGVWYQADVARALALHRHSARGEVVRRTGVYDVLAVERVTRGICVDQMCTMVAAVNAVAGEGIRQGEERKVPKALPVVTLAERTGSGVTSPPVAVADTDEQLLTLGRQLLVDPGLFDGAAAWRDALNVTFHLSASPSGQPGDVLPKSLSPNSTMKLRAANTTSGQSAKVHSYWLDAVAYVFCSPPVASFVRGDPKRLCGDRSSIGMAAASAGKIQRQKGFVTEPRPVQAPPSYAGRRAVWAVGHEEREYARYRPMVNITARPLKLLGRPCQLPAGGGRNVDPRNPSESALATRLGVGTVEAPGKRFSEYHAFWGELLDFNTAGLLTALSQSYDRAVFGVPPPDDPATNVEVLLSVIVVVPELVALIATCITTRQWTRRDVAVLVFIFGSGLVSMAGIVALAARESSGAAWRAAALRNELMAGGSYLPFTSNPALRSVTLLLIARVGYRPRLLWAMATVMAASYVVVSVGVGIIVWAVRRQHSQKRIDDGGVVGSDGVDYGVGGGDDFDWGDDAPPPVGAAATTGQKGGHKWLRRQRRRRDGLS